MGSQREWLLKLRADKTQESVAKLARISRSAYANIENGKRDPSVAVARQIAEALGFDWTLFFDQKCFVSQHTA